MILFTSSASSCTFQVHHIVRNLRRSELEADLDTQEDGSNEALYDKFIGLLPMVQESVSGTIDKSRSKNKRKGC